MAHDKWREWLQLSLYGELSETDQTDLEGHLKGCNICCEELEQLKRFQHLIAIATPPRPDQSILMDARRNLRTVLQYEMDRPGVRERLFEWFWMIKRRFEDIELPSIQSALGGLALVTLGVLIGLNYNRPQNDVMNIQAELANPDDILTRGDVDISNVRFLDSDPSDGSIEFVFEAVRSVQMKGSLDDPLVQQVLSFAVVNEQNPGVRLKAINAAGAYEQVSTDEFKNALITALKTDSNSGVRKEAFYALIKYPFDSAIKDVMVHVLTHDGNAALRIEAINMLQARARGKFPFDQDLVEVLKTRMETDDNAYIRTSARIVLDDIANP